MIRRLARLLIVLLAVATLALIGVWVMTNTDFGRARVRNYLYGLLSGSTHGIVRMGAVTGDLLSGATVHGISITDSAGRPFLKADSVSGRYKVMAFLSRRILLTDLRIYRPDIVVEKLPNAKDWNYRILWPASKPNPADTVPGFGSWIRFENAKVFDGQITVRSPWSPRTGLTARVRDSLVKDALAGGSRLAIVRAPGGFQKVIELQHTYGEFPIVRISDPTYRSTRLIEVAALRTLALPFRPPAADIRNVVGRFEFNDDSIWWKGARVNLPNSKMHGDGAYLISNGDMKLAAVGEPAAFNDFQWIYPHMPKTGGGTAGIVVVWRGATQDYVIRDADARTQGAHVLGDIGVTVTDTIVFHDANLRFTGLTTKLIKEVAPAAKPPREGVLAGSAKFKGTFKRLDVAASDITFAAYNRGTSRVIADGLVGVEGTPVVVSARNLHVRVAPLQIDIVKLLFPTLPVRGTLTGTTTLNGSGRGQLVATNVDVTHVDGPNRSRATGRAAFHTTGRQTMDLDLQLRPIALAELTKFAPALPLKGHATGPLHAHGPIDFLRVDTYLRLPDDAIFALKGPVDFKSAELGYDVRIDGTAVDLSQVMVGAPHTDLTGGGTARGRGFKPRTMFSELDFAFGPSTIDTIAVDSIAVKARLADGIANVAQAHVSGSGALIDVNGQFGLDSTRTGTLNYTVNIDSLATFSHFLPASVAPDTGAVKPRPGIAAAAMQRARVESARIAKQTEVQRAISGGTLPRIQVDTPKAIPRSLVGGNLHASGTIAGSIDRFNLQGSANGTGLVVRGNTARHLVATYSWIDAKTAKSKMSVTVRGDTISAGGFSLDSVAADLSYLKPNGTFLVRVRQNDQRDVAMKGDFTLDKARNELRLADLALRFDTTTWQTTHPSAIHWGTRGIEVANLELTSGPGRRIYANGLLPTEGTANFDLQINNFAVENITELLQSDLPIAGRLNFEGHISGRSTDPHMQGTLDFLKGKYQTASLPDVHGNFEYGNRTLALNATAVDSLGHRLAVANGTVPVNLALSGVTGSRLLDRPIDLRLQTDSLPLALIPNIEGTITDVAGTAYAKVNVAGTLKKPELRGNLTISDAQARLAATGTYLTNVNGSIRMNGDSVYVDSIAGSSNGRIRLGGTLAIGDWREPAFNLTFKAVDAQLINNDRGELHANADLTITGPFAHARVDGTVQVVHGVLYIPESTGKTLVGPGDPQLFSVVDTSVAMERELFPAESPLFKGLEMNVALSVERGTWVRSRDANVELYTEEPLQINVEGDALTLTGAVNADRGEYSYLSRRFNITRGTALFIGTPDLNPTLQVTAEYQVKTAANVTLIKVVVAGTLQKPRISLESNAQPPLSQSDLLSFLAFGQSTGTLLQFGSGLGGGIQGSNVVNLAGARLAGVALGVALDELEGQAARSLGVDVLNITPGDFPAFQISGVSQFLRATEIEAGRYVSPSTFVSVVMTPGLFSCAGASGNNNSSCAVPGGTIQYRTNKGYRFEASLSPRYILNPPTLDGQTAAGTSQFGAFVIREWRF